MRNPTLLSRVNVTFEEIEAIAEYFGQAPSSIYRVAMGHTRTTRVHGGVIRALLDAGWTPKAGIGQVMADLEAREAPMPPRTPATAAMRLHALHAGGNEQ